MGTLVDLPPKPAREKSIFVGIPPLISQQHVTAPADPDEVEEMEAESSPMRLEGEAAQFMEGVTSGDSDPTEKLEYCQQQIGYEFKNIDLLLEALTHASGAAHRLASNERLEFLGDAILGMVVCEWLYHEYPDYSEGDLTKIKSAVVSRRTCGGVAKQLHLERCLIVGKGVTRNRSFPKSLISDVFESVVAAVYLDGGLETIRPLIHQWLAEELQVAAIDQGSGNHKSVLQQLAQRDFSATPGYRLLGESGPDHSKSFQVVAIVGKRSFTPAWGRNKKEAEQRAAANALAELNEQPIPFSST